MTLVLFGSIKGIGIGTVIVTIFNGAMINTAGKIVDRFCIVKPMFPALCRKFDI